MRRLLYGMLALALLIGHTGSVEAAARKGSGQLRFRDGNALSDKVTVLVFGASAPDAGTHYQGWLGTRDGTRWINIGRIDLDAKGNSTTDWVSPSSENLLASYEQFVITADGDAETPAAPVMAHVAYSGTVPSEVVSIARALAVAGPDTPLPSNPGLASGLKTQASGLANESRQALSAAQGSKVANALVQDERMLNRIVGINDGSYGDWDKNGRIEDRSDTYGVMRYVQTVQALVQPLTTMPTLPDNVKDRTNRIIGAAHNISEWSMQIRNLASVLGPNVNPADAAVVQGDIAWLARRITDGADLNGDGKIDDAVGEGGSRALYNASQELARVYFRPVK